MQAEISFTPRGIHQFALPFIWTTYGVAIPRAGSCVRLSRLGIVDIDIALGVRGIHSAAKKELESGQN